MTGLAAEDGDEEDAAESSPSKTPKTKKKKKSGSGKGKGKARAEAEESEDVLVKGEEGESDGADELARKRIPWIRKAAKHDVRQSESGCGR